MSNLREQAVALAEAGFRVFPLIQNGKTPALETDWKAFATSDPAKVRDTWTCPVTQWEQPYNIGIALDADTLVVDVDVRDGKQGKKNLRDLEELADSPLPATYRIRTPTKGDHHYYRVDGTTRFKKELTEHVDLKTIGGYVVGEGSVIDGKRYARVDGDAQHMAHLPAEWVERGRATGPVKDDLASTDALVDLDTDSALARAVQYLSQAEPAIEGDSGDLHTFKVAARVLDFGISPEQAVELMLDHWNDNCQPPWRPEDLQAKVHNVAKYRQNPVGVASPEAEFEPVEVEDRRSKPERGKLYYDWWKDNEMSRANTYLIEGWYDVGAMVVSYGESNAGKSNVVLSQAIAIATGKPWAGARTRQGLVLYVAAEGAKGFRKRIVAYRQKYGLTDIPFGLIPCQIDLLRPQGDVKALVELVREAEKDSGHKCVMIVVDTLFRALAGGNENAPEDMGALVKHCDTLRAATGATVHLIHHSGKNQAAGARGHSSLKGATDTEIEIVGDRGGGTVVGTKQRDIERSLRVSFRYEVVDLGTADDGSKITSIVTHAQRETEFETRLSGLALQMHEVLLALQEDTGGAVPWSEWESACLENLTNSYGKPLKRTALFAPRRALAQADVVKKMAGEKWMAESL